MPTIINTKLGENKGRKRVFIEGAKLKRAGIEAGQGFDLEIKGTQLVLNVKEEGRFRISRRRSKAGDVYPVIDLTANEVAELFSGVKMLRVLIKQGRIVISAHHQQVKVEERVSRLMKKLSAGEPLDVCSLFHGGGILDAAFHSGMAKAGVGSRLSVAVELEGKYLESSMRNNAFWDEESIAIEGPIEAVNLSKSPSTADILLAGIPCNAASRAGISKNKLRIAEDHAGAGAMFFHFLQFVQAVNASVVVVENVPEYAGTASMSVIRTVLASLGYHISERVLDGNEFGALEARKRLCVVAVTEGVEAFDLESVIPQQKKPEALQEVLEPVCLNSERWKSFDYLAQKELSDLAAGKGFKRQVLSGEEALCGTIGKGYAKCRSTEPFIKHPENESLSRLLTPVEHARVKGIPQSLIDGLSETKAHEVLGQSIIYPAFEAVAKRLAETLASMRNAVSGTLKLAA